LGTFTTGGTGKSPLVGHVAQILAERGETVCILTRGYGRKNPKSRVLVSDGKGLLADPEHSGDEPFELAKKLLGKAIVIADADRVAAAKWAKRRFGVTAFVLDDGFQHRRAKRNIDIVCIDATNPFGGGHMLPAGHLREPLGNLRRADVVVITRSDLVDDISNLRSEISDLSPSSKIFLVKNRISRMTAIGKFNAVNDGSEKRTAEELSVASGATAFAFCGLGNPENFWATLQKSKVDIRGTRGFADHYSYSQKDIDDLVRSATDSGAMILLTTAKDAVKLSNLKFGIPCFVVEIEIVIDEDSEFRNLL